MDGRKEVKRACRKVTLYPSNAGDIPEEDVEWAVRIAMEARRRVKEQQKRIGAAEFHNTHSVMSWVPMGWKNLWRHRSFGAQTASAMIRLSRARFGRLARAVLTNT